MSKTQTRCAVWDLTVFDNLTAKEMKSAFKENCKKYCFQLEKGEKKGKQHWQCRVSLKDGKKTRKQGAIDLFSEHFNKFHVTTTSNANKTNCFYVMKKETRISGPYQDTDRKIPRDLKAFSELLPWQEKLKDKLKTKTFRTIHYVYDKGGNLGKTIFCKHMGVFHNACMLPFCNDYKDIMRIAYDNPIKKIFLIDMPKAVNKDKLNQMFGAIEHLKGGYCFDDRYGFKDLWFSPPEICIFSNSLPNMSLLSKDRWKIWIIKDNELLKFNPDKIKLLNEDESDIEPI